MSKQQHFSNQQNCVMSFGASHVPSVVDIAQANGTLGHCGSLRHGQKHYCMLLMRKYGAHFLRLISCSVECSQNSGSDKTMRRIYQCNGLGRICRLLDCISCEFQAARAASISHIFSDLWSAAVSAWSQAREHLLDMIIPQETLVFWWMSKAKHVASGRVVCFWANHHQNFDIPTSSGFTRSWPLMYCKAERTWKCFKGKSLSSRPNGFSSSTPM